MRSLIRSTKIPTPAAGLTSMKARSCPSGDQDIGALRYWLEVRRSRPPLPSANYQKMFIGPELFDSNAIRLPSGVQSGL
jgi:hypothetical protein